MAPKQAPTLPMAAAKAAPTPPQAGKEPKEAKEAKAKKKAKKKKAATIELQDWDEPFPPMAVRQRDAVTGKVNSLLAEYKQKRKKIDQKRGTDPATLPRSWKFHLSITGIENLTNARWEIFIAASMGHPKRPLKHKFREKFTYTRSYKVAANEKKQCRTQEEIYNQNWEGSYFDCQTTDVCLDVWAVSKDNFNSIVGSARRTFYDMGNESVYQSVPIMSSENGKRTLGYIYINVVLAPVMKYTIQASNWQFVPSKAFAGDKSNKALNIEVPTGPNQSGANFRTDSANGPRYLWPNAGVFTYTGTKASLSMEAMQVSVIKDGKLQGKAIISMITIGEYPIAVGKVKKLKKRAGAGDESDKREFLQGRVGGSLVVTSKSVGIPDDINDEAPSIPSPMQPASSLVAFHLSPRLQYLIVDVWGADGLPVADMDCGSSNPFVRVKYDGMVQQSEPHMATLHPVFNHTFYIPILVTDERIRTQRDFYERLLPLEMKSKQYLEIEIWHWDNVPTEFLGGMKLDPSRIHEEGMPIERSIVNKVKKAKGADDAQTGGDEDDDMELGLSGALTKKYKTQVHQGRREKLEGSALQRGHVKATVSFDACFVKPFDWKFHFPKQADGDDASGDSQKTFKASYEQWDLTWPRFLQVYSAYFPDGLKEDQRRFPRTYQDTSGDEIPLPRLISPLALPDSLGTPLAVQHWVRCMEFTVPPSQRTSGKIHRWQDPQSMLSLRRGSIQDHAVILCCALIGLRKDAFVCKGTVQGGKEHAWVMTREQAGTVTFWETTTAARFHLASRWQGDPRLKGQEGGKKVVKDRWAARTKSWPKGDWQAKAAERKNMSRDQLMHSMNELLCIPIAPWKELYKQNMLCAVPYESIEVVFNHCQAWGNVGNHHPTCIYYDMEDDPRSWKPLIRETELITLTEGQGLAIPVGPALSEHAVEKLQKTYEAEIRDCIRIMRMRRGTDTIFEEDSFSRQELRDTLQFFVGFLENESRLDFDWCFNPEGKLRAPWGAKSPFDATKYVTNCQEQWSKYWKARKTLDNMKALLPVKENHFLSGVPLHFSCTDMREIRFHILNQPPLQEYLNICDDEAIYFVASNIVSMPASVASVWIFVGVEVPMSQDYIREGLSKEREHFYADKGAGVAKEDSGDEKSASPGGKKKKGKKGAWLTEDG